jgi:hypothetical protein
MNVLGSTACLPLPQKVSSAVTMMLIAENMDSINYVIFTTSMISTKPTFVKIVSRLQFHHNIPTTYLFGISPLR